ncbi:unnamed protein product [Heterobilharzia americana]|nr:unnamed protein product [Heterobilharzia americana]
MSSSVNKDQLFNITNEIVYSSSHLNHQQIQLQQQQLVNQYVASQVLNEFIMLPGERKNLQLSLIAKQMGQITITGLGFEWSYLSAHQSAVADNSQYQTLQHHLANLTPQNGSIPNAYSSSTTNPMLTNSHIYNSLSVDKSFSTIDTVSQTMMVNYNSIPLSSSLPPPPPSNTDYTTSSTTSLSTIGERNSVRGKILFNKNCPDGDDNDNNKHKRFTKLPLDWSVTQPAPALRVFFSSFPNQLYEGEICSIQISLTNSGLIPLTNLRVASVWPGLFAFGSIDASIGSHDFNQSLQSVSIQPLKPWIDVPCNQSALNGKYTPTTGNESSFILMPGITISRTIWLRGPHLSYPSSHRKRDNSCSYRYPVHASSSSPLSTVSYTSSNSSSGYGSGVVAGSSVAASYAATTYTCPPPLPPPPLSTSAMLLPYAHQKTVHVVFQYESAKGLTSQLPASQQQQPFSGCRYVRHRCEMELKPSLHFEAMANCLNLTDVSNLLISVQIKNVVNSTVPMAFQILQIYCISRYWSIKPIESNSDIDTFPSIRTGEIITLHFKASFMKNHSQNVEETEKENGRKNDTTIGSVNKFLSTIHFDHHHHHQQQQISMLQQQSSVFLPKCDNDVQNSSVKQSFANSYNSKRTMISPAQLEFFCRSGINWSNSPNELTGSSSDGDDCMSSLDINLIIVWKGVSETPSSNLHHQPIWGQSHLRINQLNYSVQIPYQCNNTNNITGFATYRREYQKHRRRRTRRRPQKVENHLNKDESNQLQYTESDLANLVRFRLDYPRHVRCSNVCDERDTVLNKLDDDDSNKNNRRHHCQNIDSSSYTYSQTFSHTNGIRSPLDLNFSCQSPSILHCEPNRLSFREQTKKFMVTISVQAEVYNSSKWPIVVQLDMNNNGDNTNKQSRCEPVSAGSPISSTANGIVLQQQQPQQQINPFRTYPSSSLHIRPLDPHDSTPYIPSLIWIGLTKLEFHLKPYETKCVTLKALAPRPGVYNVCTVTVKAAFLLPCDSHSITQVEHSHSSFITQNILPLSTFKNHNVSSLIIVE